MPSPLVFLTPRLRVCKATPDDAAFFHRLWTHPQVMKNVGFPWGLPIPLERVYEQLAEAGPGPFDCRLLARRKCDGVAIGEAKLGAPDEAGLAETDIKLLPEFWGQGYGSEIKRGLLRCTFAWSDCQIVQASPNRNNPASIAMQESVGGRRVGETVYEFPEVMRCFTTPVNAYLYHVLREEWVARNTRQISDTIRLRPLLYADAQSDPSGALEETSRRYHALVGMGECYRIEMREEDEWQPRDEVISLNLEHW